MKPTTEAWIDVAELEIRQAQRDNEPSRIPEGICFHAQQCIEKYLKAILNEAERPIPYVHDLGKLLMLAVDLVPELDQFDDVLETISPFAVATRYPPIEESAREFESQADRAVATM